MPLDSPDKASDSTPLSGKIFETHPEARREALALCHSRRFHLTDVHQPQPWECVDCGSDGSDRILWRDVNKQPAPRAVHTEEPMNLTHNPEADFAERMRERGLTPEERKARDKSNPVAEPQAPVHVTREQAKVLAQAYGLHLVDSEGESGVTAHMSEKLARLEEENMALKKATQAPVTDASPEPAPTNCADCGLPLGHLAACPQAPWAKEGR